MYHCCCGFGHNALYCEITEQLNNTIRYLVEEKGVDMFLTGGMGDFDMEFSSAVRKVQTKQKHIQLILVKPYFSNELNTNKTYYLTAYDDIWIPNELAGVHYKAAIQKRNRWMIDQSQFVLSGVYRDFGGAYQAVGYAKKAGKTVINLMQK